MTDSFSRSRRTSDDLAGAAHDLEGHRPVGGDHDNGLGRRRFLARSGRCLSALFAAGTATSLGGCTLPVRSFQASPDPRVVIPLHRFPELRRPGGLIKVRHPSVLAVYVRCVAEDEHDAISAVCTHQGCIVDPIGSNFHCPCHGSAFARTGSVTSGPAREPLELFAASRSGDTVVLDLSEGLNHA